MNRSNLADPPGLWGKNGYAGLTLAVAVSLFTQNASADTLYKCQGLGGQIHYQDHECLQSQPVTSWEMKGVAKDKPFAPASQTGAFVVILANQFNAYRLPGIINGIAVDMIVDTGASQVSIPIKIAERLKIGCDAKVPLYTANGTTLACTGMVRDLQIGGILLHNIEAVVLPNDESSLILLGGSALNRLKVVQQNGEMRLSAP